MGKAENGGGDETRPCKRQNDAEEGVERRGAQGGSRFERARADAGVTVNIVTPDAESFRRSRTQVASDIARAVAFGRRGM